MFRALVTLARPKGMILIALLPVVGFTYAFWDHGCTIPFFEALPSMLLLWVLWAVPHAGTMWLNASLDRDEGEVLFGSAAPVPPGIERYAYATLVFAVAVGLATGIGVGLCVLGCAILSVLYSHPRTAWKGHAWLGPLSNALGYGVLSPLGGFLHAGLPPTVRGAATLGVSVTFILASYLAAQAFQEREDRARGYRTLVALRGARATLDVLRALLVLSVILTLGLAAIGWYPRAVLVAAPLFFAADRVIVRWRRQAGGGDESWARKFFWRLALAGLLCLVAVSMHFAWTQATGRLLGGLGTAAGHPSEILCYPIR
jgi:1,4-dihydroxy-2-naphthoate octaprenyltransferase